MLQPAADPLSQPRRLSLKVEQRGAPFRPGRGDAAAVHLCRYCAADCDEDLYQPLSRGPLLGARLDAHAPKSR